MAVTITAVRDLGNDILEVDGTNNGVAFYVERVWKTAVYTTANDTDAKRKAALKILIAAKIPAASTSLSVLVD